MSAAGGGGGGAAVSKCRSIRNNQAPVFYRSPLLTLHNAHFFFFTILKKTKTNKQTSCRRNIQITQCNGENKLRRIENTTKQVFFL